jgi:YidC/Oxa1 family membrane protein insertase
VKILDPLYFAVAWVIVHIHSVLGSFMSPGSGLVWVLTIVVLVVLMRLILVPLFVKQMHATRKMSALAPQMAELRKKYKNDRQTLNEETMKLYRENGVNPLGGCLPLVAQLPLFFALFGVLRAISGWKSGPVPYGLTEQVVKSAQKAHIFGATIADKFLFAPPGEPLQAKIVILFTVVVSVVTTYLTVRQSTKRGMTPQMTPDNPMAASQKYMTYIVPFFALSGLYWAFGLVLYWMTTNLWTLGQQYVLFRRYPAPVPAGGAATGTAGGSAAPAAAKLTADGKQGSRQAPAKPAAARPAQQPKRPGAAPGKETSGQPGAPGGSQPARGDTAAANGSGGGLLRRLGRRQEPGPAPEVPPVKVVRQQQRRQSRSKRSGKR